MGSERSPITQLDWRAVLVSVRQPAFYWVLAVVFVTVMGYPGVSANVIAVVRSRDMFNREAQQRVVPDPTISVGNIGKILRAADGPVSESEMQYAPSGDTYQLTINHTGGGNSGGPMFDPYGRVIGIFFASRTGDARVTFSLPIRYGLDLMSVAPSRN